jgi:hypothetical protein
VAAATNLTSLPAVAFWVTGCVVMAGGPDMSTSAPALVTEPALVETTTE